MRHLLAAVISVALTAAVVTACGHGPADHDEDFTEEVKRICADNCEMNLACREPPAFESYEECEHICLHTGYIYNDTDCGEARRGVVECVASQPTCELYLDTYDVHADDYTCKAEKDHWVDLAESCGQSDEDPFPHGEP